MRIVKIVLGLGSAVLLMALAAVPASATWDLCKNVGSKGSFENNLCSEAQANGAWEWGAITTPDEVRLLNVTGQKLHLEDMKAGTAIECTGEGEGTVGPGNGDVISKITASGCTFEKAGSCESSKPVTANAVHLPWKTELFLKGAQTWDKISEDEGHGTPGWDVECTVFGIFKIADTCEGEAQTKMENLANGTVEASFEGEASGKAKCSVGGAEQGLVKGNTIIEAKSGNGLKVLAP